MTEYTLFDPQTDGPLHELSRKEAQRAYDAFISGRHHRIDQLSRLLEDSGIHLPDFECVNRVVTESSLDAIGDWFYVQVSAERPCERPSALVFSIAVDIGILMGDLLIASSSGLRWTLCIDGKSNIYYHRPVIIGFNVANKGYCIDIDYLLCQYAYRIIRDGRREPHILSSIFATALERASTRC